MLHTLSHLLHLVTNRRCPSCGFIEVRRSAKRNFFEVALLPFLLARPFRCENCNYRFYGSVVRKNVQVLGNATAMPLLPPDYPALVYGRGVDEEPFHEETNVRVLNLRAGLITLSTRVEPGQQLILLNVATEENQRCHVAFVGDLHLGRSMVGIQFSQPPRELWRIPAAP